MRRQSVDVSADALQWWQVGKQTRIAFREEELPPARTQAAVSDEKIVKDFSRASLNLSQRDRARISTPNPCDSVWMQNPAQTSARLPRRVLSSCAL